MNHLIAHQLLTCARAYADACFLELSSVARSAAKDARFFDNVISGKSVTSAKSGVILDWFAENWPEDVAKPSVLLDHIDLRQWEASNTYSCNDPMPRIVVPS